MNLDPLIDRRQGPRAPARFRATWSDHALVWSGEVQNFGPGGLYVLGSPLPVGKTLRVELELPGQEPFELPARVAHANETGIGIALDVASMRAWERSSEIFERAIARDPALVARVRRQVRSIEAEQGLWITQVGPAPGAGRTPNEKRILHVLERGHTTLADLRDRVGPAWRAGAWHALLALIERDVVTTTEERAGRSRPAPGTDWAPASRGERPPAAERYLARARQDLAEGRRGAAVTALKLALSLCPGDREIEAELKNVGG